MDKWLSNPTVLKIVSLIFGVALWFVVTMSPTDSVVPTRPVDTQYTYETKVSAIYDANQYFVDLKSNVVLVKVKGSATVIESVRSESGIAESKVYVDLSKYQPGSYEVDVLTSGFPKGASVSVEPRTVQVAIEGRHSKELPVTLELLGTPAPGTIVGATTFLPERVHVSGTAVIVEKIAYVKAYLNVDGATESISQEVKLQALDYNGNFVNVAINPQSVTVNYEIYSLYPDDGGVPGVPGESEVPVEPAG